MKQFTVDRHTTPGTPLMDPVNMPKVPVYDTLADAEADLANLEEGQIVMTPDEGAEELLHPVDVVEKDNTHAVQSGAVASALSYSTTEQKTGGYWIDGKPIYRKVIETTARTIYDNWNTVALDASVHTDYVIKCYMVSTSKNGTGGGVSSGIKALVYADGTVHINNQYSNVNNVVYCILEYSKTTD